MGTSPGHRRRRYAPTGEATAALAEVGRLPSGPMDRGVVTANGVDFTYFAAGPADGPLALCLHGFPDTAHTWRHLVPRLADLGFRAVAPFMRGYAPTSVPADGAYDTGT